MARHRQVGILEPISFASLPQRSMLLWEECRELKGKERVSPGLPLQEPLKKYVTKHQGYPDWETKAEAIGKGRGGEVPFLLPEEEICCMLLTSERKIKSTELKRAY